MFRIAQAIFQALSLMENSIKKRISENYSETMHNLDAT